MGLFNAAVNGRLLLAIAAALAAALIVFAAYWRVGAADSPDASPAAVSNQAGLNETGLNETHLAKLSSAQSRTPQARGANPEPQPRDARGWVLLARRHAEAERFQAAADAYEKALALPSKVPNDPAVWCEYADALGMTQEGKLAGKPRQLIDHALSLKADHPRALEMAGSAEYELGDYAAALRYWRPLLAQLQPGSQMHEELTAAIARTERLAARTLPAAGNRTRTGPRTGAQ